VDGHATPERRGRAERPLDPDPSTLTPRSAIEE